MKKISIHILPIILSGEFMMAQLDLTLGKIPNNNFSKTCVDKVKVSNERPNSCSLDGDVLYPVINEQFNYKEELLNNYRFNYPYAEGDSPDPSAIPPISYLGNGDDKHSFFNNIRVENGELIIEWKKQTVTTSTKTYSYTGGMLLSLYQTRQGVYYAKIKFPDNIYFWPSFWIQSGVKPYNYQEIDFCEMFDKCPSEDNLICKNRYHQIRMNIYNNEGICSRQAKINLPSDFYTKYHIYKGVWTDYRVEFHYIDEISSTSSIDYFNGIATKYVKPNPFNFYACEPLLPYYPNKKYCTEMANEPECIGNIIFGVCTQWNWVFKDVYFPNINPPYEPMYIFVAASPNLQIQGSDKCKGKSILDYLNDKWNTFSDAQKQTKIDYLIIYQPIKC